MLQDGDILLTEGGDYDKLGRGTIWRGQIQPCLHQNHIFVVRTNSSLLLAEFFSYLASSPYEKRYFLACAKQTTNLASINSTQLKEFPVLVPSLEEQKKIAEILSAWDDAIAKTEKLITAKQKLKTSLMQKLLTGKLRFQQFQFDIWHTVKLGKVAEIRRGASPRPIDNPDYFSENGRGWVRIADVTASKTYLTKTKQYLSQLGESKSVSVDPGDLIMSICATIGIPRIVEMRACIHDGFVVIRSIDKFNKLFLYHFLNFISLKLAGSGQPGTQKNLNTTIVSSIEVPAIFIEEQVCIANVISLADEEIYKLEAQLYHIQTQKRGLMQKLLTGKWRVTVEKAD